MIRSDEARIAVLLEQQEVHMLSSLVVGVPEFMQFRKL